MKFKKQETPFSCAASSLRNCILSLENNAKDESYYRKLCNTTEQGTDTKDLLKAISELGYLHECITTKSQIRFKKKLKECLLNNGASIVVVDNLQHWVAVLEYNNKILTIIDSDFSTIKTKISIQNFCKSAFNFDKINNKYYFHFININKNDTDYI